MEQGGLTIGEVAALAEVGVETLRYYERRDLLPSPTRDASGYRRYREEDVIRVRFIRRAKELGFTLAEISELLDLRTTKERTCEEVQRIAWEKIGDMRDRMRELSKMIAALETLSHMCSRGDTKGDCPFLEALESAAGQSGGCAG